MASPGLLLALLLTVCVSLATYLHPIVQAWSPARGGSDSILATLMGDGRRLFGNHFFAKADVYFHAGQYPSIFDDKTARDEAVHMSQASTEEGHAGSAEGEDAHAGHAHDHSESPEAEQRRDWIEWFGRHFYPTKHVELTERGESREILPWLRLSAEMDPERVETYTVTAYWLRTRLGKVDEAEQFLREGLRANPNSTEILFELGRIYEEDRKDLTRARNLWRLALQKWQETEPSKPKPDEFLLDQIATHLAQLEEKEGHYAGAIEYLQLARKASPVPERIDAMIESLRQKLAASPR